MKETAPITYPLRVQAIRTRGQAPRLYVTFPMALAAAAAKAGWKVYAITTYADAEFAPAFAQKVGAQYPFYKADDKLLKTIIRASPGLVVWKDGSVVDMYHHRHLPKPDALLSKWK